MIGFKKRDTKDLFKAIARQQGVTAKEVRDEIKAAIEDARNSDDPEQRAEFKKYFGNRVPTPEEFIYTMSRKMKY